MPHYDLLFKGNLAIYAFTIRKMSKLEELSVTAYLNKYVVPTSIKLCTTHKQGNYQLCQSYIDELVYFQT